LPFQTARSASIAGIHDLLIALQRYASLVTVVIRQEGDDGDSEVLCGFFHQSIKTFRSTADDFCHSPSSHKGTEHLRLFAEQTGEIKRLYGTTACNSEFNSTLALLLFF